jgi:hypothetical protein
MIPTDGEIEVFIRDALEHNFELLQLESGHSLAADVKQTALNQALFYWQKLKEVATRVTETEVRLNLPGQTTPAGRKFGIEGVVDIVREEDRVVMYDIKTHLAEDVRQNIDDYEHQLNIYAHIWQNLRGQQLDELAVIATAYPDEVKEAITTRNPAQITQSLQNWDPLVEIEINREHVDEIITTFGGVVDCIEDGKFTPASIEKLRSRQGSKNALFATTVCRNCDARFSCASYRRYSLGTSNPKDLAFTQYLNDFGPDIDQQEWLSNELDSLFEITDLE